MTRHATTVGAALLGAFVASATLLAARRLSEETPLPSPAYLPAIARGVLHRRMARHAEHMSSLVQAVVRIDRETVIVRAQAIADEPLLARPTSDDATELNNLLPEKFFELQDELRRAARGLVSAAGGGSVDELAAAHAGLTSACVRCHGIYLQDPPTTRHR